MTPEEPPPEKEWELPLKWVLLTAAALWIFGAASLLIYLLGGRGAP